MRGRKPDKLELTSKDKALLRELLRDGETPLRIARRAQILLSRGSDPHRVGPLGQQVERDPATLWRVCQRYRRAGLPAALYDAPRSGRPRVFSQKPTRAD